MPESHLGITSQRHLALLLRAVGCLDLLALVAVVMPQHWMDVSHKFVGLGPMPHEPIVGYLARSASALYALHGAMMVFISFDVGRYERLIRFRALAALVHGAVILGIDLSEPMPALWRYGEGPAFAVTGILVLWLQRGCGSRTQREDGPSGPPRSARQGPTGADDPR
ncbi:MAG: hypothetical protein ACM3U2_06205 [Deltaproteobacteria bacterium]